jgi:hypothetical protein
MRSETLHVKSTLATESTEQHEKIKTQATRYKVSSEHKLGQLPQGLACCNR